jgi:site-specific recombinase XerD
VAVFLEPSDIPWTKYPAVREHPIARKWLESQVLLGLARNTVEAYGRGVEEFLVYCAQLGCTAEKVTRDHIAQYVGELRRRPGPRGKNVVTLDSGAGLANATLQQRLTAVRLFFDYLVEEEVRVTNPVGRGRYTPGKAFGGKRERSLLPHLTKLPWIPTDTQWDAFLVAARGEPIRNRCMIGLAYDAGLRREELCLLESSDLDPAHRTLHIRAETSKGSRERVVPYSAATGELLRAYLVYRHSLGQGRGRLFWSESRRNRGTPITVWTWSKVIRRIADGAKLPRFSTHTFRHLCLTDLARAGWDLHEIARFAGHRSQVTTQQYIHLSGRDLAARLAQGMEQIHTWRLEQLAGSFLGPETAS